MKLDVISVLVMAYIGHLVLLPTRYYDLAYSMFWPVTHNGIVLLSITFVTYVLVWMRKRNREALQSVLVAFFILLPLQVISLLYNLNSSLRPIGDIVGYFVSFYIPISAAFCSYNIFQSGGRDYRSGTDAVLNILIVACCASWLYVISGDLFGYINVAEGRASYMYRNFLTRLSPTAFGALCSVIFPISVGRFAETASRKHLVFCVIAFFTMFATFSRWNIVICVALSPILFVRLRARLFHGIKRHFLIVTVLFVTSIIALVGLFQSKYLLFLLGSSFAFLDRTSSSDSRFVSIIEGVKLFTERPILGFGPGEVFVRHISYSNGIVATDESADSSNFLDMSPYNITLEMPHSFFVEILVENGLVGLFAFVAFCSKLGSQVRHVIKNRESSPTLVGLAFAVFTYLITMLFSNYDNVMEAWIISWIIIGLFCAGLDSSRASQTHGPSSRHHSL